MRETDVQVARRIAELGTPPGAAGQLLGRAARDGAVTAALVARLATQASERWPDGFLAAPHDPAARAAHERLRDLVAARRDVLHRATLLTMPAGPGEQGVLLRGLARAVDRLGELADSG